MSITDLYVELVYIAPDEIERCRLARRTENLDNSRRAILHILQDLHHSSL